MSSSFVLVVSSQSSSLKSAPVPVLISWIEFQSDKKMAEGLASSYFDAFIHETGAPVKYGKSNHEELRRFHAGETSQKKTRRMLGAEEVG